jgi:nitrogen fixation protein NifU and related proteins
MNELQALYQDLVMDHGRSPRHAKALPDATHIQEAYNPLCGDRFTVYLRVNDDAVIEDAGFEGQGCAISTASASLMMEALIGLKLDEASALFTLFQASVCGEDDPDEEALGKLVALVGVRAYPMRVKCATLVWHAMHTVLGFKKVRRLEEA